MRYVKKKKYAQTHSLISTGPQTCFHVETHTFFAFQDLIQRPFQVNFFFQNPFVSKGICVWRCATLNKKHSLVRSVFTSNPNLKLIENRTMRFCLLTVYFGRTLTIGNFTETLMISNIC